MLRKFIAVFSLFKSSYFFFLIVVAFNFNTQAQIFPYNDGLEHKSLYQGVPNMGVGTVGGSGSGLQGLTLKWEPTLSSFYDNGSIIAPSLEFLAKGWMNKIDGSKKLNEISIPGTYESCAYNLIGGGPGGTFDRTKQSQGMDIFHQLKAGIRYLDVYVSYNFLNPTSKWTLTTDNNHYLGMNFDTVLTQINNFMSIPGNENETIIIHLEARGIKTNFSTSLSSYIASENTTVGYARMINPKYTQIPTIGSLRGKIYVIDNENGDDASVGLVRTETNTVGGRSTSAFTGIGADAKNLITSAKTSSSWVVNDIAGRPLFKDKAAYEKAYVNKPVFEELNNVQQKNSAGTIVMAFPGQGLIYRIIKTNFFYIRRVDINFQFDCYHSGLSSSSTGYVYVRYYRGSTLAAWDHLVPDCDGYSDGYSHVDVRVPGDGQIPVTHIEVESANYSKFFMDELYLNETKFGDNQWDPERGCDDCEADKILRQWGIDGGGTWDISLDPAKGVACVRFEVPNGLAYNCSTPTSLSTLYDCNITSVSHTDPICAGDSTGQAAVSGFQSNSPPFYYSWSNGSNSASVNNLPRGKHTVIVNDNSGCYKDTTIEIVDPPVENFTEISNSSRYLCLGESMDLWAKGNGTVLWYTSPTGGSPIATTNSGGIFTVTPTIAGITTYYAELLTPLGCVSSSKINRQDFRITVNPLPDAPINISAIPSVVCHHEGFPLLQATDPDNSSRILWYTQPTGGTPFRNTIPGGNIQVSPTIAGINNYYAETVSSFSCISAARTPVSVLVHPQPANPILTATPNSICPGDSIIFNGTGGSTIEWFGNGIDSTTISGSNYKNAPTTIFGSTKFRAQAISNFGCTSELSDVSVYGKWITEVDQTLALPSNICLLGTSTDLYVNGYTGATVNWYTDSLAGSLVGSAIKPSNYTATPTNTGVTKYYAELIYNGCVSTKRAPVSVEVNATFAATNVTASPSQGCIGDSIKLNAIGGATIFWYDESMTLKGSSASGEDWVVFKFSPGTYKYYAEARTSTFCQSSTKTEVIFTINPTPAMVPDVTSPTSLYACPGDTHVFNITTTDGAGINWYSSINGGVLLGSRASGGTYKADSIEEGTNYYYAEAVSSFGCVNINRTPELIIGRPQPGAPILTSTPSILCEGESSNLVSTFSGSGTDANWYSDSLATNLIGNIGSHLNFPVSPLISGNNTYYAKGVSFHGCIGDSISAVTVALNPKPIISNASVVSTKLCEGGNIDLVANLSANEFDGFYAPANWSHSTISGSTLDTSNAPNSISFTSGNNIGNTDLDKGILSSTQNIIISFDWAYSATLSPDIPQFVIDGIASNLPKFVVNGGSIQTGTDTIIVPVGKSFSLSINSQFTNGGTTISYTNFKASQELSNVIVNWYDMPTGGTLLGSSMPDSIFSYTPSTTGLINFYAEAVSPSGCLSPSRALVSATINLNPTLISALPNKDSVCLYDSSKLVITATNSNLINWYVSDSGGVSIGNTLPGSNFTIFQDSIGIKNYFAEIISAAGCFDTLRTPVNVFVKSLPANPADAIANPSIICYGDSISLSGSGNIKWYLANSNLDLIDSTTNGANLKIKPDSAGNNYYYAVAISDFGCINPNGKAILVVTTPLPNAPTNVTINSPVCLNDTITMSSLSKVNWYNDSTGGISIGRTNVDTNIAIVPSQPGTYSFYAEAENENGCISLARTKVTAQVNQSYSTTNGASTPSIICLGDSSLLNTTLTKDDFIGFYSPNKWQTWGTNVDTTGSPSFITLSTLGQTSDPEFNRGLLSMTHSTTITFNWNWTRTSGTNSPQVWVNSLGYPVPGFSYSSSLTQQNGTATIIVPAGHTFGFRIRNLISTNSSFSISNFKSSISGVSGSINWYTDSIGGSSIGNSQIGENFSTTPLQSGLNTYYSDVNVNGCISDKRSMNTLNVKALPTAPTSVLGSPSNICMGQNTNLSATGGTINWYTDSIGGSSIGSSLSGANFTITPSLFGINKYYAENVSASNCSSESRTLVTVSIFPAVLSPSNVTVSSDSICLGMSTNLNATGDSIVWYTDSVGGTSLGSSASGGDFTVTPNVKGTNKYYAENNSTNGCGANSSRIMVSVHADTLPVALINIPASPQVICFGDSGILNASGGTITWYSDSIAGITYGNSDTGIDFKVLPAINGKNNYYAEAVSIAGCISSKRAQAILTTNPLPDKPINLIASPATICLGASSDLSGEALKVFIDFKDDFDPINWTASNGPSNGVVYQGWAPGAIRMRTGNGATGNTDFIRGVISTTADATIMFNWELDEKGSGVTFLNCNSGHYLINGIEYNLTANIYSTSTGSFRWGADTIIVPAGSTFALRAKTSKVSHYAIVAYSSFKVSLPSGNINWYTDSVGGTNLGNSNSGSNFNVTPSSSGINNYYAETVSWDGCTSSSRELVVVKTFIPSSADTHTSCTPFLWIDGNTYSSSNNTAKDTVVNSKGCDSIIHLDLTIFQPTTSSQTLVECQGFSIVVGTNTYDSTGIYIDTFTNNVGCDSIFTTNLTINQPTSGSQNFVECQGFSVIVGLNTYNSSGVFKDTLTNNDGCDSILTTTLTINQPTSGSQTLVECQGFTVIVGTNTYNSSGVFKDTLTNNDGCDSILTTTLIINQPTSGLQSLVECQGFTIIVGTNTYNSTGIYVDTLTNHDGCDSILTTTLTINQPTSGSQSLVECQGFSVIIGTNTYNSTGIYKDTLTNNDGCDSILTTTLIINQPTSGSQSLVECQGFSVIVGTNTYDSTGIYIDTLINNIGCDSIFITTLTINSIDISTNIVGVTISSNLTGANYQWLDCNTAYLPIMMENGQSFTATSNGNYAVEITVGTCVDTSVCENIISVGIPEKVINIVSIYPNPTEGFFTIDLTGIKEMSSYTITTEEGRLIEKVSLESQEIIKVNLINESAGVYFLFLEGKNYKKMFKIIKL